MVHVEYRYGSYKKEIKQLLRDRLKIKYQLVYCDKKIKKYVDKKDLNTLKLKNIEEEINNLLSLANGEYKNTSSDSP
jgi:predicted  nucleic acid-binding Zn-ribbon protein